jgi:hypothetical protein
MIPKEKAKELYDKYEKMYPLNFTKAGENFHKSNIIKCTLIAVEEIIKALRKDLPEIGLGKGYWYSVKQEIEKL